MISIFIMLVIFQVKHLLCDYVYQTEYMLGKFKKEGWFLPLLQHSSVHSGMTFIIAYNFTKSIYLSLGLALLDLVIHFIVDRIKAHPNLGGKYKPQDSAFWTALGIDQMAHHLTHYLILFIMLKNIL